MKRFFLISLCLFITHFAVSDVMMWMVATDKIITPGVVDGVTVQPAEQYSFLNAARVMCQDLNGNRSYLDILARTSSGELIKVGDFVKSAEAGITWFLELNPSDYTGYSFALELGVYENDSWNMTYLISTPYDFAELRAKYMTDWAGVDGAQAWKPTAFTAVPEPTGGMLLLVGGALLLLRRKRHYLR